MTEKAEVAIALVGPVGVDTRKFEKAATERLSAYGYEATTVRLSDLMTKFEERGCLSTSLADEPELERIRTHMNAGDELRCIQRDILAVAAAAKVAGARSVEGGRRLPLPGRAWIFSSLKNPAEVHLLRRIYREGFFLVGLFATEAERRAALRNRGISDQDAADLIDRDLKADIDHGQQTRKTFELADAWVGNDQELRRVIDLMFGDPFVTPTEDENGMAIAYTSALRSSDLSRQVGAAIVAPTGEVVSTGHNEVPAPGGGQYGATGAASWLADQCVDPPTARDFEVGCEPNHHERREIEEALHNRVKELLEREVKGSLLPSDTDVAKIAAVVRAAVEQSPIQDITEYGRAVHAEMAAILSASRSGVSVRGATLYCTTFPCHNCAKHIVASGIARVVFVEPYPKSKAIPLHGDAITLVGEQMDSNSAHLTEQIRSRRTRFEPFIGVGPRRYFDLFSMRLGAGASLERKDSDTGRAVQFEEARAAPRVPLSTVGYLWREGEAVEELQKALDQLQGQGG